MVRPACLLRCVLTVLPVSPVLIGRSDQSHIEGFNSQDVFNSVAIGRFEFADGTVLTSTELLARGFDIDGTNGSDTLVGTNTTDRIHGLAGNDLYWRAVA